MRSLNDLTAGLYRKALAAVTAPLGAGAQARKIPRIGVMSSGSAASPDLVNALCRGLAELGWVEGQNILVGLGHRVTGRAVHSPVRAAEVGCEVKPIQQADRHPLKERACD